MYQALQGNLGLAKAINYFVSNGDVVAIPLNDTQPYDLVVEINGKLSKVSVKTGKSSPNNNGIYTIQLRNTGGGRKNNVRQMPFDNNTCDYVFIYTVDENLYLIPSKDIKSKAAINVNNEWSRQYQVFIKRFDEFKN